MNNNNNNPQKNTSFGNPNPNQSQQPFANQFQLSQYAAAHAHSKAQAQAQAHAHAQFQAQMHAQGISINQSPALFSPNLPSFPASGIKRGMPQKPVGRPPGVSNANAHANANAPSPMRMMDLTASQRYNKKKQKLPEKHLLERVAKILPQSALYTELLEFESRVDAALVRKKLDIQDAIKNPPCIQKTLRIYVFNTFDNQTPKSPLKPNDEPPTWTLKIVGRILEEGMDNDQAVMMQSSSPKFSSFFKRVTISLDQRLYPDNHMIVWDSARTPTPHEGFEVKRKGDKEFIANIRLEMNYVPEKYKLSLPLMEVLGVEVDTRSRIIAAIWHYVKARKLQNAEDPSYFNCDPALRKVFGEDKMKFTMVSHKISHHLSPPQPIHLEHRIKLSGNSPAGNACYDVLVDVPFPLQRELNALLASTEKAKEIEACDEAICTSIRKINEHRKRRAFFLGFSQSPVEFIDALIESQGRELKLAAGETSRNVEKEHRAEFYNQPWVEDAVIRYLNRKPPTAVHGST